MLIGWYNDRWWEKDDPEVKCTSTEMREAITGYISLESVALGDPSVFTVANIVSIISTNGMVLYQRHPSTAVIPVGISFNEY